MSDVSVSIGASIEELNAALGEATSAVRAATGQWGNLFAKVGEIAKSAMTNPLIAATAAIAGVVVAMKESVSEAQKWNGENAKMARQLGVTTKEAAALKEALDDVKVSTETFQGAVGKVGADVAKGGEALERLGVSSKNADGSMRSMGQITLDVIEKLRTMKPGAEQAAAAASIFGKSWQESLALLKLTPAALEEAKEKLDLYGIGSADDAAQSAALARATKDVGEVFGFVSVRLGNMLIPALARFAQGCADFTQKYARDMVDVVKSLVTGLDFLFRVLRSLWEMVVWVGKSFAVLGLGIQAVYEAMQGRFTDAARTAKQAWAEMQTNAEQSTARLKELWSASWDYTAPKSAAKDETPKSGTIGKTLEEQKKAAQEQLRIWQKQAEYEQTVNGRSLQWLVEYWDRRIEIAKTKGAAYQEVLKEMEIKRAQDANKAAQDELKTHHEATVKAIETDKARFDRKVEAQLEALATEHDVAKLSAQLHDANLEELYALDVAYEDRRYALQRQRAEADLNTARELHGNKSKEYEAAIAALEKVDAQHRQTEAKAAGEHLLQVKAEWANAFQGIAHVAGQSFNALFQSIFNGGQNLIQSLRNIFLGFFGNVLQGIVEKYLQKLLVSLVVERTATAATKAAEIGSAAALASANTFASIAAIPIVGPAMAPGAAAASYAQVMAMMPLASAAGGWDLPAGLNPVTQLHEREMVLPAALADRVRGMTEPQGAPTNVNVTIHALDSKDVERYFRDNPRLLGRIAGREARNGRF